MRKMILGITVLTCALPTFAMDGEKEEHVEQPQQQQSLELGNNSQQRNWWWLSESIKGGITSTLELTQWYLGNSKEAMNFEGATFEKIPEDRPKKGMLYLQEVNGQLKCTGFITVCENQIEKLYPISVFLLVPEGLIIESSEIVQADSANEIQSLFKHALGTLPEDVLMKHIDQEKVLPEAPSIQKSTGTGWWPTSLLTPSLGEGTYNINGSWGLGSLSGLLARSSEGKRESEDPGEFSEEMGTTTSSLPNFPAAPMSSGETTLVTHASNTDPLDTPEPLEKGMWGGVAGYLGYINLGGYLGGKKEVVTIALKERDQKDESKDLTEEELKEWRLVGREEKEEKYRTFLMSDLPESGVPGEDEIYVRDFYNKLQVKFTNVGEPMLVYPKNGETLEDGKKYVGTKEPFNKPQILSISSRQQVVTAILNINLNGQPLTLDLLNSMKPQIIGMLELENFIPKEEDEVPLVDRHGKDEKDEEEKSSAVSFDSDEEDPAGSFL